MVAQNGPSELATQARKVLRRNDTGEYPGPSPEQYPHQWSWDSAVIALGLSHLDLERAHAEIRSLLQAQWQDGMLPYMVYAEASADYFPPADFWQTAGLPQAGNIPSSGITQPPLLATALRACTSAEQPRIRLPLSRRHIRGCSPGIAGCIRPATSTAAASRA